MNLSPVTMDDNRELDPTYVVRNSKTFRKLLQKPPPFIAKAGEMESNRYLELIASKLEDMSDYQVCYYGYYMKSYQSKKYPDDIIPESWEDKVTLECILENHHMPPPPVYPDRPTF